MDHLDNRENTKIKSIIRGDKNLHTWIRNEYKASTDPKAFLTAFLEIIRQLNYLNNAHDMHNIIDSITSLSVGNDIDRALQFIVLNCASKKGNPFPSGISVAIPALDHVFDRLRQLDQQAPTFTQNNLINWPKFAAMGSIFTHWDNLISYAHNSALQPFIEVNPVQKWISRHVFKHTLPKLDMLKKTKILH